MKVRTLQTEKKIQEIKLRLPSIPVNRKLGKQQHHCGLRRNQEEMFPRVNNKCYIAIFMK